MIISMLPAGKHVAGTFLGDDGLLATIPKDTLILDASTIDAATARQVGDAAAEMGIDFMDTPVSGGVAARQPAPRLYVRGTASAFSRARPILEGMGSAEKIFMRARRGQVRSPRPPTTCCSRCI